MKKKLGTLTFFVLMFLCGYSVAQDYWIRAQQAERSPAEATFSILVNSVDALKRLICVMEFDSSNMSFSRFEAGRDAANWKKVIKPHPALAPEFAWANQTLLIRLRGQLADTIKGVDLEVGKVVFAIKNKNIPPTLAIDTTWNRTAFVVLKPDLVDRWHPKLAIGEKSAIKIPTFTRTGREVIFPLIVSSLLPVSKLEVAFDYDSAALALPEPSDSWYAIGDGLRGTDFQITPVSPSVGSPPTLTSPKIEIAGLAMQTFEGPEVEVARLKFVLRDTSIAPWVGINANCSSTRMTVLDAHGMPAEVCYPDLTIGLQVKVDATHRATLPETVELFHIYPNPLRTVNFSQQQTTIRFSLPKQEVVTVEVYDVLGRLVKTLVREKIPAGFHRAVWSGDNHRGEQVGSGVYFVRLRAGTVAKTQRLLFIK